jgi:hypothetical protein
MNNQTQRLVFIAGLIICFFLGAFLARPANSRAGALQLEVSPKSASITIDNKKAKSGENRVTEGKHEIKIKKSGFKSESKAVDIKIGDKIYEGFALSPQESKVANWYKEHPEDEKLAEGIQSHTYDFTSSEALKNNSFLQVLPLTIYGPSGPIKISSGLPLEGSTQPAVYVSASSPADRQSALGWMRNNGYNPANMDIFFYGTLSAYMNKEDL